MFFFTNSSGGDIFLGLPKKRLVKSGLAATGLASPSVSVPPALLFFGDGVGGDGLDAHLSMNDGGSFLFAGAWLDRGALNTAAAADSEA